jgi:hypothetical protein
MSSLTSNSPLTETCNPDVKPRDCLM